MKILFIFALFVVTNPAFTLVNASSCPNDSESFQMLSWQNQYECRFLGAINQGPGKLTPAEGEAVSRVINAFYRDKSQNYAEVSCISLSKPNLIHQCFLSKLPEQKDKVEKEYNELQRIYTEYSQNTDENLKKLKSQKEKMDAEIKKYEAAASKKLSPDEMKKQGIRDLEEILQDPEYRDYRLVHHYTGGSMKKEDLEKERNKLKQKYDEVKEVVNDITSPNVVAILNKMFASGPIANRLNALNNEFEVAIKKNINNVAADALDFMQSKIAECRQSMDFYFNPDNGCDLILSEPSVQDLAYVCRREDLPHARSHCDEYKKLLMENEGLEKSFLAKKNKTNLFGVEQGKKVADGKESDSDKKSKRKNNKSVPGKDGIDGKQGFLDWVSNKLGFKDGDSDKERDGSKDADDKKKAKQGDQNGSKFGWAEPGEGSYKEPASHDPYEYLQKRCAANAKYNDSILCKYTSIEAILNNTQDLPVLSYLNQAHAEAGRFHVRNQVLSLVDALEHMQFENDKARYTFIRGAMDAMRAACPSSPDVNSTRSAIKDELNSILDVGLNELRESDNFKTNSDEKLDEMVSIASNILTLKTDIERMGTEFFVKDNSFNFKMLLPCEGVISNVLDFAESEGKNCPYYGPDKWLQMFQPKSAINPYENDPQSMKVLAYYNQYDKVLEVEDAIFQMEAEIEGIEAALQEFTNESSLVTKKLNSSDVKFFDELANLTSNVEILQTNMETLESKYGKESEFIQKYYEDLQAAETKKLEFIQSNYPKISQLQSFIESSPAMEKVYQKNAVQNILAAKKNELKELKSQVSKEEYKLNSFTDLDIQPASPKDREQLKKLGIKPSVTPRMSQKQIDEDKEKMKNGIEPSTSRLFRCGVLANQLLERQKQLITEIDKLAHLASTIDRSDTKISDSFVGWVDSFFADGRVDGLKKFLADAPNLKNSVKRAMTIKNTNPKEHKDVKDYINRVKELCQNPDEEIKDQLENNPNFLFSLSDCQLQKANMRSSKQWSAYNSKWEKECSELQQNETINSLLCLESGALKDDFFVSRESRAKLLEGGGILIDLATCVPLAGAALKLTSAGVKGIGKVLTKSSASRTSAAAAKSLRKSIAHGTKVTVISEAEHAMKLAAARMIPTTAKVAQRLGQLAKAAGKKAKDLRLILAEGINPNIALLNKAGVGLIGLSGGAMTLDWTLSKNTCEKILGANQVIGQFTSQEKEDCVQQATAFVPLVKMLIAGVALNGVVGAPDPKAKPVELVSDSTGKVFGVISPDNPSKILKFSDFDDVDLADFRKFVDDNKLDTSQMDSLLEATLKKRIGERKGQDFAELAESLEPEERLELLEYEELMVKLEKEANKKFQNDNDKKMANELKKIDDEFYRDMKERRGACKA